MHGDPTAVKENSNFLNQISKNEFSLFIAFILRNSNNMLPLDLTAHKYLDQNTEKFCFRRWKYAQVLNMKELCMA